MVEGYIHSTESFGSADGPGVRFLIFVSGCRMRCRYCHNADTWQMKKGTLMTADELLDQAERYRSYWGPKGGITVSGGEPLLQPDFLLELFAKAKARGINTCIDTALEPFTTQEPFFHTFERLIVIRRSPESRMTTSLPAWSICPGSASRSGSGMCSFPDGRTTTDISGRQHSLSAPFTMSRRLRFSRTTHSVRTSGRNSASRTH